MTHSFDGSLDKAHHGKTVPELLSAPPDALNGVSQSDARHLRDAFGVESIRDLATLDYVDRARAILAATGLPSYDPGPPRHWEALFQEAPLDHYVTHPSGRFRVEFGPVYYRGRLDGSARVLVVGQDPANDEILAHRNLVGTAGQRLQRFLQKVGLTRSYLMLNTFLFPIFETFDAEMRNISLEAPILSYRNALFDRVLRDNRIQAIVATGSGAQHAVDHWPGRGEIPRFDIQHPAARDAAALLSSWNAALPGLIARVAPDEGTVADPTPYGADFTPADSADIPRGDLPFGIPSFHGTGGGRSTRDGNHKIIWAAP